MWSAQCQGLRRDNTGQYTKDTHPGWKPGTLPTTPRRRICLWIHCRKLMSTCLIYLPVLFVVMHTSTIQYFAEDPVSTMLSDRYVEAFCDFVLQNYICNSRSLPSTRWTNFTETCVRTINNWEAFHSKLNELFYLPHPRTRVDPDAPPLTLLK